MARIKAIDRLSVERMRFVKDYGQRNLFPCEIIFATGGAQDGLVKLASQRLIRRLMPFTSLLGSSRSSASACVVGKKEVNDQESNV